MEHKLFLMLDKKNAEEMLNELSFLNAEILSRLDPKDPNGIISLFKENIQTWKNFIDARNKSVVEFEHSYNDSLNQKIAKHKEEMLSLSERMGSNVMSKTKELRVELRRNTDSNKSLEEALEANTETINSFLAIADKFISSVEKIEERGNSLEAAVKKMGEYSANFDNLLPKHEKIISKVKEHGENTYKNIDRYIEFNLEKIEAFREEAEENVKKAILEHFKILEETRKATEETTEQQVNILLEDIKKTNKEVGQKINKTLSDANIYEELEPPDYRETTLIAGIVSSVITAAGIGLWMLVSRFF